jgi:tetratricopeptide (TPR) repeat protein
MAMEGLFALVCASTVLAAGPSGTPSPKEERETTIADTLAVQTALQQGKECLAKSDFKNAVYVLESQLPRINGSRIYLSALQEAYRGLVKELRLARQDAEAQKYLDRLRILDPGAVLDKSLSAGPAAPSRPVTPASPPAQPAPKIRMRSDDEGGDPFSLEHRLNKSGHNARDLVSQADKEFSNRHYREARDLYEKAHEADRAAVEPSRERWAYCMLYYVVEQINQPGNATPNWSELEQKALRALDLAPRLDYAKYLLAEIQKRRSGGPTRSGPQVAVRHLGRGADGWNVAESANFRVYHNQPNDAAEQAAQVAERTRMEMQRKWFDGPAEDWNPRCELFLYATAADYSRATGVPAASPGHSEVKMENGRVVGRRVYLHCDDANMLPAVLPHEATHVVIAGQYGEYPVPRWADEGMAVLSEPRDKVERHMQNLTRCRQQGQLLNLRQLVQLHDYPEPQYISAFYAESVSLVEFLTQERGPQVFTQFLRDSLRGGYESALQKYYGLQGFADLEQRWARYASSGPAAATGLVQRSQSEQR